MQPSLGVYIRQSRHQLSLTQTELGGERYSKSYVSAVERGSILPSQDALRFFAEQLHQPLEQFEPLLQQAQQAWQAHPLINGQVAVTYEASGHSEIMTLLDLVLSGAKNPYSNVLRRETARFSQESLLALPLEQQACYAFLRGLAAQEKGELAEVLPALEFALPLAPTKYQSAILHALGLNYYQMRMFQNALSYHIRALDLLQMQPTDEAKTDLLVQIELHCGADCQELGDYHTACKYYRNARRHLQATHNLKIAAELYLALGYCTYAAIYQSVPSTDASTSQNLLDVQTQAFQRAVSYLIQSRTLYQTCQDAVGKVNARLLQTMILLDFSSFRQYNVLIRSHDSSAPPAFNCETLLNDAEEQCRQMFLEWQEETFNTDTPSSPQVHALISVALAYLVRIHGQRGTLARLAGYDDTAVRERSLAAAIYQEAFGASSKQTFSWETLRGILSPTSNVAFRSPTLPRLPDATYFAHLDQFSLSEIYFAAGEMAEELGCSTTNADYAYDCCLFANRCFQAAVEAIRQVRPLQRRDPGYLGRCYQRYITILERRMMASSKLANELNPQLLNLLKDGLAFSLHASSSLIEATL